uniref:NADH dehydrogenase subunit 6 n=1 Tax=Coelorinchus caelorhincus TaxID=630657 RepID=UPI0028D4CA77|nr:NADH dehydrogenase subunit 6 [Coelorinchus caelorhincus]WMY89536.1 NADH dehydrogenase subunit 6 [Coelorinchus caelorhincus]
MSYMMMLMMVGFVLGAAALASNPSPVYAVLGLVLMAGMACLILINSGGPFLSLLFFLVYLGGMLVVFAHCVALAAERYPKAWGDMVFLGALVGVVVVYAMAVVVGWVSWFGTGLESSYDFDDYSFICSEGEGLSLLYDKGVWLLLLCVVILLVVLTVVLELTRGRSQGALRAI